MKYIVLGIVLSFLGLIYFLEIKKRRFLKNKLIKLLRAKKFWEAEILKNTASDSREYLVMRLRDVIFQIEDLEQNLA